jgi:hypothetical protein
MVGGVTHQAPGTEGSAEALSMQLLVGYLAQYSVAF